MARAKTGGRQKGTPNKTTILGKDVIAALLADYSNSGLMDSDFQQLKPKERLAIAEKLMQYTLPKMQSTSVDFNDLTTHITIENQLKQLADK